MGLCGNFTLLNTLPHKHQNKTTDHTIIVLEIGVHDSFNELHRYINSAGVLAASFPDEQAPLKSRLHAKKGKFNSQWHSSDNLQIHFFHI